MSTTQRHDSETTTSSHQPIVVGVDGSAHNTSAIDWATSEANRTGRPFTGDYAGDLLYETLIRFGFARGSYQARPDDGLSLVDARITNAVRCVPPENKPTPAEIKICRGFLAPTIAEMENLRAIVTLGRISHESTIAALAERRSAAPLALRRAISARHARREKSRL